ncbi:tRNA (guanosine(37)-N1)-methyltransferase TrmD [Patescibacteria group bacterium]|nr:tRNA (guanosine(37)-N1)-methyltransferase TrmD [Patescibacteria group bacterium]
MSSKIRFDILTIFPEAFESYLNASMMKRARAKKLIDVCVHDLRKFARDKHKKVDDRPYGGGPGMVVKIEPIMRLIVSILKSKIKNQKSKVLIILFSAAGKQFTANTAANFAKKYDRIIMIAGHYEGVDERVKKVIRDLGFAIQELSVGPYVLTGGELPAMIVIDAVSRHIPGFLGKGESLEENRYGVGVPAYARPEIFTHRGKKYAVPKLLLSGNHAMIETWRKLHAKKKQERKNTRDLL